MSHIDISHLTTNGKTILLACDQGMEHGPEDFNEKNIDPNYIYQIGIKQKFNAVIFGRGIAEHYHQEYKNDIQLIVKLNGHTRFNKPQSWGKQNCSVEEAIKFGAVAVGYTIHMGAGHEAEQMQEFSGIVSAAHANGIPAIAWVYPRGEQIKDEKTPELCAYAARIGLELGADIVKAYNPGNVGALKWMGMSAGKCKVIISGGDHTSDEDYADQCKMIMQAGLMGIAVGRNVWQSENPDHVSGLIKEVIYEGKF
jgi:class I fructose-bisphosphate aldolase